MLLYFNSTCWITLPGHYLEVTSYALIYVRQLSIQTSLSNEKEMPMTKKKNKEKFEDTKGVIRIDKSKGRQFNGQMKKEGKTNNGPHNTTHIHID